MRFQFRFTEPDRERYGDGTYELDVSPDGLSRLPIGTLEEFEEQTGMRVLGDWLDLLGQYQLKAVRACLWLARGVSDPTWKTPFDEFRPDVLSVITGAGGGSIEYLGGAEGNAASPAKNRATRRQSPKASSSSSAAGRRRASAS